MILGIHCGVRGGYAAALERAVALGCAAMQMLPSRRHHDPSAGELGGFRRARLASGVARLLVHSRFAPGLASSDEVRRQRSVAHLARELGLARALGAEAFVLHAGAYSPGAEAADGRALFARSVSEAWSRAGAGAGPSGAGGGTGGDSGRPRVVIENVPGGGRRLGGSLEELAELGGLLEARGVRAGFCLDTAHAWAQGYDLASAEGMWKFIGRAHRLLDAARVAAFHLNDTRALLGSHREHHWHWGRGYLGSEGPRLLLGRDEFRDVPGIIEPPPGELEQDSLDFVRRLMPAVPMS